MSSLIEIQDLQADEIYRLWDIAGRQHHATHMGDVGWSFEGSGVRTRTTFLQAFSRLGLKYVELPNLLKSGERPVDLAGYLDPFYVLYVIRESDHERLRQFAQASERPVINAMTNREHPCEVLSDAYFVHSSVKPIGEAKVLLWGPITNVLRSWHSLAKVMGLKLYYYGPEPGLQEGPLYAQIDLENNHKLDVVVTDGWPDGFRNPHFSLTLDHLEQLGRPKLLPCPPFTIGEELAFDPRAYSGFTGYDQKRILTRVQMAIIQYLLND